MKTTRFLFTIVGFGALTLGLSFAGEPSIQPSAPSPTENHATSDRPADQAQGSPGRGKSDQTDGTHSKSKDDSRASEQSSQAGPISKAMATHRPNQGRPKKGANRQEDPSGQRVNDTQTKQPSVSNLHQPGLNQAATAARDGLRMNTIGSQRQPPARLPVVSATTAPLPCTVRGRGAASATIGGLAASSARSSTAAINGAAIKPKP